jgi:uncharacterized protein YecE (DUF72 family)
MHDRLADLASEGVFIGTSSWKYPGWVGTVYDESRYLYRGKFAKSRFEEHCLAEYAEVFKTVCVEAAYYTFPSRQEPSCFKRHFSFTESRSQMPNIKRHGGLGT